MRNEAQHPRQQQIISEEAVVDSADGSTGKVEDLRRIRSVYGISEERYMKQVKIRRTFPRNKFFECVLSDWKESVDDRNFRSVLSRALVSLKAYPLDVATYADLKNVRGIGDQIAQKLEGAWHVFCSQNLQMPTVKQIEQMKKDEFLQFVSSADLLQQRLGSRITTTTSATASTILKFGSDDSVTCETDVKNVKPCSSGIRKRPPNAAQFVQSPKKASLGGAADVKDLQSTKNEPCCSEISVKMRSDTLHVKDLVDRIFDDDESMNNSVTIAENDRVCSESLEHDGNIVYHPLAFPHSQVILIVDNRESGNARKFQQMCKIFEKKGVFYEMRSLSVGDYLWIMRMHNGTEMVFDYIVERKTLDDLWSSIKQKRYEEQKKRLMSVGIPNVIYILEGCTIPDPALEQALVTTHVENRFLIYRTNRMEHTSLVLSKITERLTKRARTQELTGITFEDFQQMSKKTQRRCVKDIFLRQLTVCPQMSVQKALLVVDRFPSFAAVTDFYASLPREQRAAALTENIPGITKAASTNMARFYAEV